MKPAPSSVENFMQNRDLTSQPPSHWSNSHEESSHWSDAYIHTDRNISKPNYLEEEEDPELPVDYAFLGRYALVHQTKQKKYLFYSK